MDNSYRYQLVHGLRLCYFWGGRNLRVPFFRWKNLIFSHGFQNISQRVLAATLSVGVVRKFFLMLDILSLLFNLRGDGSRQPGCDTWILLHALWFFVVTRGKCLPVSHQQPLWWFLVPSLSLAVWVMCTIYIFVVRQSSNNIVTLLDWIALYLSDHPMAM